MLASKAMEKSELENLMVTRSKDFNICYRRE